MGSYSRLWTPGGSTGLARSVYGHERDGFSREGRIVARAFDPGFTLAEYLRIVSGAAQLGYKRRRPADRRGAAGQPIWHVSDYTRRQRDSDLDRLCLDRYDTHNIACNAGRYTALAIIGNFGAGYAGVSYFAVGTGAGVGGAAPGVGDLQLWTEAYRQNLSSTTISGNQVDLSCVFASGVANFTYTEAGIFGSCPGGDTTAAALAASGGSTASAGANTGMLFAHASYNYTKSSSVLLTNDYFITES